MRNVQKPEKIHLGKLIREISKGRFAIPDFQREFDWEPWDVRDLIKSMFMDYYVGTLLLWESNEQNYETLACDSLWAFQGNSDPEYILLDGQQRLTAIHYALFAPPVNFRRRKNQYKFFIRIDELIKKEFDEAFFYASKKKYSSELINNLEQQFEQHLLPLKALGAGLNEGDNELDVYDWIKKYKSYWSNKADNTKANESKDLYRCYAGFATELKEIFEDLLDNYYISYISLDKNLSIDKVCDIFTHINSKGKALDTFDLLNSITRKHDIKLKDMYRDASAQIEDNHFPGFELKKQIMMVMSIIKQNYCSPKYLYYLVPQSTKKIRHANGDFEEIILINDKDEFESLWLQAVGATDKCLKVLRNPRDYGAINKNFLPYPSIIPALSAIKDYVDRSDSKGKVDIHGKIRKWYWASIFEQRYSSSVETTTTKDFMDLKKWFEDDVVPECIEEFEASYREYDLHREVRNGSARYKAIFNVFILNEARDWETFELPEYENLDDHHIVPKSWGKKQNLGDKINTILNKAPLSANTNRNILRDMLPNQYLREMFKNNDQSKVEKVLASHLISKKATEILLRVPFTADDFDEFLDERRNSIIATIESKLIHDRTELPEDLKKLDHRIEVIELTLRELIIDKMNLSSVSYFKEKVPPHVTDKIQQRIAKEKKKNPVKAEELASTSQGWLQFADLRELEDIIASKKTFEPFSGKLGSVPAFKGELSLMADLRNAIRHSREVDQITRMKGEAAIMWFEQQLQ